MPDNVDLCFAAKLPPREAVEFLQAKGYAISWNWWEVWDVLPHEYWPENMVAAR